MAALQLLGMGAPQSVVRGAPRSGDRAAAGMLRPCLWILRRSHPAAAGSHLPAEDTAPPCAVAPFRVVAPCPAPQKIAHSTVSNCRFRLNGSASERIANVCFRRLVILPLIEQRKQRIEFAVAL